MNDKIRERLLAIFNAGLDAVRPDAALLEHLKVEDGAIVADGHRINLNHGKIRVVGGGKGAAPLAAGVEKLLGDKIEAGIVAVKYDHAMPLEKIEIMEAAHPAPDENGLKAAAKILELARQSGPDDLLLILLTGGASALLPAPAHGLSLADLKAVTDSLLASGATINEINIIRKHLSALAGGQLARAANGAAVLAMIVSDVIGDDPGTIASGPAFPDASTYADCLAIMEKYDLAGKMPAKALEILRRGAAGELAETPKPEDAAFARTRNIIIASNQQALEAAAKKAAALGYAVSILPEPMQGEARKTARELVEMAIRRARELKPGQPDVCLIAGGETTVTIRGAGRGGRNQEMALAAAIALEEWGRIYCLFAGTDGTDGPTDAAGGFAFSGAVAKMGGRKKAEAYLAANDSNAALARADQLLITGPTKTNVMDMAIIIIEAPASA